MKRSREQTKAELMAEAEAVIEELLEWERRAGAPELSEMEDEVLRLRQRLGKRLLEAVIEDQEARQPVQAPRCSQCGMEMRYKGQKGIDIETRLGGVKVERGYYYCARCGSGVFPPP
jgi:hypothetical protein